jgi:hypothetical protein
VAVVDATTFAGANIFAKIEDAYNTGLPATGGVIDARGDTGTTNIAGVITLGTGVGSKPCSVLLPAREYAFTDNSAAPKIRIRGGGIRLIGVSQGSKSLHAPATTLRQNYATNTPQSVAPLLEMSPDAGDIRGPWHNQLEYIELVGMADASRGGPAVLIKAGQYCVLRHVTVQQFQRTGLFPVQLTHGVMTVTENQQPVQRAIGCNFCLVEDCRIFFSAGGVEISGNGNLQSSSNANWIQRVVGSSLSAPAFYNHNYAVANALIDCEAEGNTGHADVWVTGIADGMRIERLYTESDLLSPSPAALLIDSDATSVRQSGDETFGSVAAGAGVAAHVSVVNSTFSRTNTQSTCDAIRITHSRTPGNPGPRGTVVSGCFVKGFTTGVKIQNADVASTAILLTQYANTSVAVADSGTSTVIWNHHGTLQLAGHLTFNPTGTWDIGASAGSRPRDLFLSRDASMQGKCQIGSSADDALEVQSGRIRLTTNGKSLDGVTSTLANRRMIRVAATPSGEVELSPDGVDIRWGRPLVALGTGGAATLGATGSPGPTVAAQNSWMQVHDHTGVIFWVPAWK